MDAGGEEIVWAIPVRIEEVKASLKAYRPFAKIRPVIEACFRKSSGSMSKLPPELVEMIMEQVFIDIRDTWLQRWRILYRCCGLGIQEEIKSMAPVFRRALERRNLARLGILDEALIDFTQGTCNGCLILQRTIPPPITVESSSTQVACSAMPRCAVCQACLKYSRDQYCDTGDDGRVYEDLTVERTPWDKHPQMNVMQRRFKGHLSMLSRPQTVHLPSIKELQDLWQSNVVGASFFSSTEEEVLAKLGIECWVNQRSSRQVTNALLVPRGKSASRWTIDDTANSTAVTIPQDMHKLFINAKRELFLRQCKTTRAWGEGLDEDDLKTFRPVRVCFTS